MYRNYRCRRHCQQSCYNPEMLENACQNMEVEAEYEMDDCACGFDEEEFNPFPENPMLGQSYVPWQIMDKTFKPCVGLKMGTIYPELVNPYMPGQSINEIAYIEEKNEIGMGCNKC